MEAVEEMAGVCDSVQPSSLPDAEAVLGEQTLSSVTFKSKSKTRESQKSIWILTYITSGSYITPQMLLELGNIRAGECHTTKDRFMTYTYLYLIDRVRGSRIEKFMDAAQREHGIMRKEIFGYDPVASSTRHDAPLKEHIGFKTLVGHYVENNPAFQPWTNGESKLTKGNIMKAAEINPDRPGSLEGRTKAQILAYVNKLEQRLKSGINPEDDGTLEFDVVKKRRAMDSASPTPTAKDDDPAALEAFENFEKNVLPALELISLEDKRYHYTSLQEMEDDLVKGITIQPTNSGVYFAWSPCLKCTKIGATRRDGPSHRLRELSHHVTVPFILIGWIASTTPFRREAEAHVHFTANRIRCVGAGTEFFHINEEMAVEYCRRNT
jgi:hypothetical protein